SVSPERTPGSTVCPAWTTSRPSPRSDPLTCSWGRPLDPYGPRFSSNDRWPPDPGHTPGGAPADGGTGPGVLTPPLAEPDEPGTQSGTVPLTEQGEGHPRTQVGHHQHPGQVASGQPDTVAGVETVEVLVAGRDHRRMVHDGFGVVLDRKTGVHDAPGQIGLLVGVEELTGQPPTGLEGAASNRTRPTQERGHHAGTARITHPQPGHVAALVGTTVGIGDAEGKRTELGIGGKAFPHVAGQIGGTVPTVVVQEQHDVTLTGTHTVITSRGD